ncbi:uncharacterized protein V6R79_025619 [Siganus canaliculatus]
MIRRAPAADGCISKTGRRTKAKGTQEKRTPPQLTARVRTKTDLSRSSSSWNPGTIIKKEQMQNLVISINIKMMQINLKYIRNTMYSNNFSFFGFCLLSVVMLYLKKDLSVHQHLQNK